MIVCHFCGRHYEQLAIHRKNPCCCYYNSDIAAALELLERLNSKSVEEMMKIGQKLNEYAENATNQ